MANNKKDEQMPETTLTQRRNQISSGAKKLQKDKLPPSSEGASKESVLRIVLWILVVVLIAVGAAFIITSVLDDETNEVAVEETEPESLPTVDEVEIEEPVIIVDEEEPADEQDADNDADETDEDAAQEDQATDDSDTIPGAAGNVTADELAEYAATDRILLAQSEDSSITLNKFRFFETASEFNYVFEEVEGNDPEIELAYDDSGDLILTFNNVFRDNVIGNGGSTEREFVDITGISRSITQNSNGVSTYTFDLEEEYESRVIIDDEDNTITLQIDNR